MSQKTKELDLAAISESIAKVNAGMATATQAAAAFGRTFHDWGNDYASRRALRGLR
jgi:hypothetical protein